ncbi:MAG: hypothetical protein B6I28_03205 [Fusobacteriia bacterium 4572_132]|nr:MAG: hypothetical protein B6I28_03205 [Fusobacteriia bacterium 4572_132]
MKKNVFIILMILLSGCRLDYYTKAEIAYKVEIKNIEIAADKIRLTGYFENVGETKNTGIKKVEIFIEVEDNDSGRIIEAKTSNVLNEKLKEISLKEGEEKNYELIFDKEISEWEKLKVMSIQTEVYYY